MNFKDNNQVCVFVSSSDNTKDVFNQVSKSIIANWNDIPYKLYVGVNSYSKNINDKFTQITSNIKGWRYELLNQVNQLPNNINYLILFLDDFLILSDVQTSKIIKIVDQAIKEKIDYLRFIPCSRAWASILIRKILNKSNANKKWEKLDINTPYYSSLQIALWNKKHLIKMLKQSGSIWDFEHQIRTNIPHFAVYTPLINYTHVVEKGKWIYGIDKLFMSQSLTFNGGKRGFLPPTFKYKCIIGKIKFWFFGYSLMILKRKVIKFINLY